MKYLVLFFVVNLSCFGFINNLHAEWEKYRPSYGQNLLCSASVDTIIYAATEYPFLYSSNRGESWNYRYIGSTNAPYAVNVITNNSTTVFTFTIKEVNSFVRYCSDGGVTWFDLNTGLNDYQITSLAATDSFLYGGTFGQGLIYCSLAEKIWQQTSLKNCTVNKVECVGDNVFAATNKGVFLSADNGKKWQLINEGLPIKGINDFAFNSSDVFAAGKGGVYKYDNKVSVWVNISSGLPYDDVNQIFIKDSMLIVGTNESGLYRSYNYGSTWSSIFPKLYQTKILTLLSLNNELYAGTYLMGVFKSSNWGDDWVDISTGFKEDGILFLESIDSTLIEMTEHGHMWRTSYRENDWELIKSFPRNGCEGLVRLNGKFFASAYNRGIYFSEGDGKYWSPCSNAGLGLLWNHCLASNGNYLYTGEDLGIFKSSDYGNNWVNISGSAFNNVMMITAYLKDIYIKNSLALYKSSNYGASWTVAGNPNSLNAAKLLASNCYSAFYGAEDGLWETDLGSEFWKLVKPGQITALKCENNSVYFAIGKDIYISTNYGWNWKQITSIPLDEDVRAFSVCKGYLYAGTSKSVWKISMLEALTGVNDVSDNLNFDYELNQNYPNPFNPSTSITFSLPKNLQVKLKIYNLLGQEIETLIDAELNAGSHSIVWTPDKTGKNMASGIYLCRIEAGNEAKVIKMMFLK